MPELGRAMTDIIIGFQRMYKDLKRSREESNEVKRNCAGVPETPKKFNVYWEVRA